MLRQGNVCVQVNPSTFKSLLQYIYTARLETHMDAVDDCIQLAVQCQLPLLKKELQDMVKKVNSFGKVNLVRFDLVMACTVTNAFFQDVMLGALVEVYQFLKGTLLPP
jgi:hypothetical protein